MTEMKTVASCHRWLSSSTVMGSAKLLLSDGVTYGGRTVVDCQQVETHNGIGTRRRLYRENTSPQMKDTMYGWLSLILTPAWCLFPSLPAPVAAAAPLLVPPFHFARPRDRSGGADLSGFHQLPYTPAHPTASHQDHLSRS